jgi:hypothetical protein
MERVRRDRRDRHRTVPRDALGAAKTVMTQSGQTRAQSAQLVHAAASTSRMGW